VFLERSSGRWVEEVGRDEHLVVLDDGKIVTPEWTGSILEA